MHKMLGEGEIFLPAVVVNCVSRRSFKGSTAKKFSITEILEPSDQKGLQREAQKEAQRDKTPSQNFPI